MFFHKQVPFKNLFCFIRSVMMKFRPGFLTLLLFSLSFSSFAQDSVFQWTVTSKKIGSNKYEILFTTPGNANWQLYAPYQVFSDVPTTEIKFDSAVQFNNRFEVSGTIKKEQNPIFEVPVNYNEGPTTWKAIVT